ncbi:MAG: class I tRNA ligase family protein [Nanoarchaeota archaeon]
MNCVIVHGGNSENDKNYNKHWIPLIKKKLEEKGIKTENPLMPVNNKATYSDWKKIFEKLKIDENSILIGHSRGCAFLVRWLGENKKIIKKLILVAPWKIANKEYKRVFYDFKIDRTIKERAKEIIIFTSNDEELDGKKSVEMYHSAFGGEIIELKNRGHFTQEEFPELLDEIISNKWPIFTTRADTIYGVTFMVVSAQHPRLMELVTSKQKKEVESFLKKIKSTSEKDIGRASSDYAESEDDLEKEGVFTGSYAINPINNDKIPVWAGNFVVADYGCGMVMAVPAHDERDFQFAKKYKIPVRVVVNPDSSEKSRNFSDPSDSTKKNQESEVYELNADKMSRAYIGEGRLVNSKEFNKWSNKEAINAITEHLEKKKLGRKTINYKLRDWLISRQRYWGTPIPIIYCDKCGIQPVPEKDLPVLLPEKVKFGNGNPLASSKEFIETKCPKCKEKARRETDTMDTFFDSSWYFLRYCDSKNKKEAFEKKKIEYWMPVDQYIGGAEHACMHLIYARFFTKALRDLGFLKFNEPFIKLFNQGMLHGSDGNKMSKSLGNVVNPVEMIKKYSSDSLRLNLMGLASPDSDSVWNDRGMDSSLKLLKKIFEYFSTIKFGKSSARIESKTNKTIKEIREDIENFRYNMAVIKLRQLFEKISEEDASKKDIESFLKMFSVFCPHIAEELWETTGGKGFISLADWPEFDKKKIDEKLEKQDELNDNLARDIGNILRIVKEKQGKDVNKVYVYCIPNELDNYRADYLQKRINLDVKIFSVTDKNKYDPSGISRKSKPGKPGIFVE